MSLELTHEGPAMNVDVANRHLHPDLRMAAELELEAARWAQIMALIELLTPAERIVPGYYREPDWTVKDLIVHLGCWHVEARAELLKIATRMYDPKDFEVERRNSEILAVHRNEDWDTVWAQAMAARTWMFEALLRLHDESPAATQWVRKAGAEHYGEHLERLQDWTVELIEIRTRPWVDERDP
jgi:hypothetical protein